MLKKIAIIMNELWRLKNRHYSKNRDESDELFVDRIAAFIAEEHAKKGNREKYLELIRTEHENDYSFRKLRLKKGLIQNIEAVGFKNNNVNFKHVVNSILEQFFREHPNLKEIDLPVYRYHKKYKKDRFRDTPSQREVKF